MPWQKGCWPAMLRFEPRNMDDAIEGYRDNGG